ncbi:MAG: hypothetical protein HY866_23380, partial [Chloroflexi bacterium]|nr:hypothetical protein [Chloroflexota bacterium]
LVIVNELLVTGAFYDKTPWREMAADVAARTPAGEPVLLDVEGEHAAAWVHFSLDLPVDMRRIVNLLPPEAEGVDRAVSLYDLRKRYRGDFIPHLQGILAPMDGVWLVYWGDEAKKHDIFDVLAAAGFVRTGTRYYEHHGYPIYAYRYDRGAALETPRARFGQGINLLRAEWPASAAPGDTLSGLLWWGSDIEVLTDYTVSVFLLDSGGTLRAQHDGYPADAQRPTSTWIPGSLIFDAHLIDLPENLPPGEYTLGVKLYTWWDGAILPTADGGDYQVLGSVTVR